VAVNVMGLTATQYGLWFTSLPLGFAVGSLIPGRFFRGMPIDRIVFWGGLTIIVSVVVMTVWAGIDTHSPLALFLPMFTMSIGQGISTPAAQAGGIALARNLAGTASGMFIFIQWTLAAVSAQISGLIADGTVYPALALILLMSIGAFAASIVVANQGARRRRRARDDAASG
jgi:DHA1 family bicyclomycin/chloramphenicol resistance-like MFS transporter